MEIIKSLKSILLEERLVNFINRKRNKTFLDSRTLFTINYNNRKTKIYLNKKFGYVDQYIYNHGIYEKDIIDSIREFLNPQKIMLDIGGNIGQHSLLLAPYCKMIYAFEPIPAIFNEFKSSISANHYKNIHLQNVAIGDKSEIKPIYFNTKNADASTLLKNTNGNKPINIQVEHLNNVLPKDLKFDVVKIDVEGFEAVVILGNKELFIKNKPVIFLELDPKSIDFEGSHSTVELLHFFFDNDYEIYKRNKNKTYSKYSEELNEIDNLIIKPKKL